MKHPLPANSPAARDLSNGNLPGRRHFLKAALTAASAGTGWLAGCGKKESDPTSPALTPQPPAKLWNLSELAPPPQWERLEPWQETITSADFRHLLEKILTDGTAFWSTVEQREDRALIRTSTARADAPRFELRFANTSSPGISGAGGSPAAPSAARYWRKFKEIGPAASSERPLEGINIALDPGHIGGSWAKLEGRWYQMEDKLPVKEGDLTLQTALILKPLLKGLGAVVSLVRDTTEPLTSLKPESLLAEARNSLTASKGASVNFSDSQIRAEAERLFYRTSEIRTRGQRVNQVLKPDLLVCLHYNADNWGKDAGKPVFSSANHLHVIAHGCLDQAEFACDDQRLDVLLRGLQGIPEEEIRLCDSVARHLASATGLPPFAYPSNNARRVNGNPYVWGRNLLANRVYHCPVVFTEPYVMNNGEVFERIQAGDYEGEREIAGKQRHSIFREYAQGVADGLAEAARQGRG